MAERGASSTWSTGLIPDYWNDLENIQCKVCDPLLQRLFRIFLLLSERSLKEFGSGCRNYSWIHVDEVKLFVSILNHHLPAVGLEKDSRNRFYHYCGLDTASLLIGDSTKKEYTFKEFVQILSQLFPYGREEFGTAIIIVYDNLVNQVLKKDFLLWSSRKSGGIFHRWERRWAVVKPGVLILYRNQSEQEKLKEIYITKTSTFEVCSHASHADSGRRPLYEFKFIQSTGKRRYLATFDILQRRQWMTAFEFASRNFDPHCGLNSNGNIHRRAFLKRRQLRIAMGPTVPSTDDVPGLGTSNRPIHPDSTTNISILQETPMNGFNNEENGTERASYWQKLTVEALCKELRKERLRANRLAVEKKRLQDETESLRKALKDEEIVRQLATRLFEEERSRRNDLEEANQQYAGHATLQQGGHRQLDSDPQCRSEEIERLKMQLTHLQDRMKCKLVDMPRSSSSPEERRVFEKSRSSAEERIEKSKSHAEERRDTIEQLRRDQEALVEHHQKVKDQILHQETSGRGTEANEVLKKLIENSRKRTSMDHSM